MESEDPFEELTQPYPHPSILRREVDVIDVDEEVSASLETPLSTNTLIEENVDTTLHFAGGGSNSSATFSPCNEERGHGFGMDEGSGGQRTVRGGLRARGEGLPEQSSTDILKENLSRSLSLDNHRRFELIMKAEDADEGCNDNNAEAASEGGGGNGNQKGMVPSSPISAASTAAGFWQNNSGSRVLGGPGMMWVKGEVLGGRCDQLPMPQTAQEQEEAQEQALRRATGQVQAMRVGSGGEVLMKTERKRDFFPSISDSQSGLSKAWGQQGRHNLSTVSSSQQVPKSEPPRRYYSKRGAALYDQWERHTRAVGSKLLKRMGFDGTTGQHATEVALFLADDTKKRYTPGKNIGLGWRATGAGAMGRRQG
ncbi:unnamed protein product, partial [Choristocarpus tenellus]